MAFVALIAAAPAAFTQEPLFHDSHFHLTNYVQEGTDIRDYLEIMGDKIGRSTLFGIPLQQTWSYENSGDFAPTYYLHSDAPLYYYSFTDAFIANAYLSLDMEDRKRFDPMITGFNPADMYAADHIRRVLETYPGVFSGIGEFTIHKEFVSSKVAGDVASLTDPALDRVLEFAGEVGLVVIIHSDIDVPFASDTKGLVYLRQMVELLERHPETTVIWAHAGLGRVISPVNTQASAESTRRSVNQFDIVDAIIRKPALSHVYFDISWSEVAKYAVRDAAAIEETASFLNTHADRILFGTDNVAPANQEKHLEVYRLWDPIWARLDPEAGRKIRTGNYERLFDAARERVRDWESRSISTP
jgi:predicted TIM-barrel fold metal-dependent hydrolase